MSSSAKTAPYGSWKSPITSDLIVAQSISLSDVRLDGGHIYWLEGRPQEQGRSVVVRADEDGAPDRHHSGALQRRAPACTNTAAARGPCGTAPIYLLQFRRRPPLSPGAGRVRAAAADAGAARARPAVAVRRRRDRSAPQPLDRRARGSHRRRRAGQCHRRRRSRRRRRAPGACSRAGTISMPRRGSRPTATGSPGWRGIIPTCRGTARCSTLPTIGARWRAGRAAA